MRPAERDPVVGTALVRDPSPRLADGLVTYLDRVPVDVELARHQHQAYLAALTAAGWDLRAVAPADDHPDSVFVEDTVVYCAGLAVLARSGAPQRRGELAGTATAVTELGLAVGAIEAPGTLDGGDVLQVGDTVYVGRGKRTNAEGARQLADRLAAYPASRGRTVVEVPLGSVLHLKSAVTALPDGTVLAERDADLVDLSVFPQVLLVDEPAGCYVVLLGGNRVLMAASAPRTAAALAERGLDPVVVDISEFEKIEGCVTCLSVLLPSR
ncbi:MAG: arginine deiminase family protein [Sporichthyaceae bacterium]|nr:arginine deiminase family protein [Sporichthyaceae bacterium]